MITRISIFIAAAVAAVGSINHSGMADACTLVTGPEAAVALGVPSTASARMFPGDTTSCLWSHDVPAHDTSRKVGVNTHSAQAYGFAKMPKMGGITQEPIAGLGDDAIYQNYPKGHPFIWVLKGGYAFSIRILTIDNPRPFTDAQEKAKLLVMAKAAVARM